MFDIKFVEEEFDLWLASIIGRDWNKTAREAESQGQKLEQILAKRLSGLAISEHAITDAVHASGLASRKPVAWNEEDILAFCKVLRTRAKPFVIAANKADLPTSEVNIQRMEIAGLRVVPCASEAEALLRRASKKDILHYLPGDSSFEAKPGIELNAQRAEGSRNRQDTHAKIWLYGRSGIYQHRVLQDATHGGSLSRGRRVQIH